MTCRSLVVLHLQVLAFFLVSPPKALSQSFDVLIVERPDRLTIFDSYQQSMSAPRMSAIPPGIPMKILNPHTYLSDGITQCIKVEADGEIFYILRDDRGELAGYSHLGIVRVLRNIIFRVDTIEFLRHAPGPLGSPFKREAIPLREGDVCIRYFTDAEGAYVKKVGLRPAFGSIRLDQEDQGTIWRVRRATIAQNDPPSILIERVRERLGRANEAFVQIYSLLGRETGKRSTIPQWYIESKGNSYNCVLLPNGVDTLYRRSIAELSNVIQTYFLGSNYDIAATGNRIEIRPR